MNQLTNKPTMDALLTSAIPLPPDFEQMTDEEKRDAIAYLNTLDEVEQIAYTIALEQLGSSFDLLRSNGFCDWKKEQAAARAN